MSGTYRDRAVVLRTHDFGEADRVIVLDRGTVVETGTPAVLLGRRSRCRDLFATQLIREEVPA